MSVNAAAFDVCAVLVVLSCLVTVAGRGPRLTLLGAAAVAIFTALLLVVSGADVLALLVLVVLLGCLGLVTLAARRGGFGDELAAVSWGPWPLGIAAGALAVVVIDGTVLVSDSAFHRGTQSASLLTLFHYRAPVAAGLLVVVAVLGAAVALLIGRRSDDETAADISRRARLEREQRMHRRRQDRAAAREQRRAARGGRA